MTSKIISIAIGVFFFSIVVAFAYFKGEGDKEREMEYAITEAREEGYKQGQLDAFNGEQIYTKAVTNEGTSVVLEKTSLTTDVEEMN